MWWEGLSSPSWAWPCCCRAACWQKLSFHRLGRSESLRELPPWRACYWISGDTWFGWASKRIDRAKCIFCGMGCPAGFTRCGHLCNLKNISHNSGTIYQRELKVRMQRAKPTKTSSNIWTFQKLFNQYLKGHKYLIHRAGLDTFGSVSAICRYQIQIADTNIWILACRYSMKILYLLSAGR